MRATSSLPRHAALFLLALALLPLLSGRLHAALVEEHPEYEHAGVKLKGYIAYDDVFSGSRPGVVIVHEWRGLDDHSKEGARKLANMGYIAMALDMYGAGVLADNSQAAAGLAKPFKDDRKLMRDRAEAGLKVLKAHALVASDKIAAMGYCFGGTTALEMARAGLPLAGAVSFHGNLDTPKPETSTIKCPVLVLHGADDPRVPAADVAAFQNEMRAGKVDWQMVSFGNAVHSFTNPKAGNDPSRGSAYEPKADARSWDYLATFLNEIFWKE